MVGNVLGRGWCTAAYVAVALVVMTVEDAQRMRLDDHATALAYLQNRFGPGRFRLTPRSEHGTKLPGTQSLIAFTDEDISMHVTMNSAQHRYAFLALMALPFNSNIPLVAFSWMAEMIP